jgi:hypothetical protein
MGGQVPPRKLLENPASEPHDHLNIKHRLTCRAKRLSGHAITHFKVLILYRSPLPESPKRGFLASLAHPFTNIIPILYDKITTNQCFYVGEESIFIKKGAWHHFKVRYHRS